MTAILALILILLLFGALGFVIHVLWYVLIAALIIWVIGFFVGAAQDGRRGWYRH
jgi:hypothetical protein